MKPWTHTVHEEGDACIVWADTEAEAVRLGQEQTACPGYATLSDAHGVAYDYVNGEMSDAVKDVIASREEMREPGADALDDTLPPGHWVDVVAGLLALTPAGEQNARARLVVCAAMLIRAIEQADRVTTPPTE